MPQADQNWKDWWVFVPSWLFFETPQASMEKWEALDSSQGSLGRPEEPTARQCRPRDHVWLTYPGCASGWCTYLTLPLMKQRKVDIWVQGQSVLPWVPEQPKLHIGNPIVNNKQTKWIHTDFYNKKSVSSKLLFLMLETLHCNISLRIILIDFSSREKYKIYFDSSTST